MKDTLITNKKLWIPVFLVSLVFFMDKLAGSNFVRKYTETRIEFSFYNEKKALLEQLKEYQKNRKPEDKLLVLFGTSHMGEFSNQYIAEHFPNVTTYNFSAPMATPSFFYFYLEEIHRAGIKIDYAIIEAIPEIFQDAANEYAIKFSYSPSFVWKYKESFSMKELETYTSANLFDLIKFPFRFHSVIERIRKPQSQKQLEFLQNTVRETTKRNNGGIPNPIIYEVPLEFFEKEAKDYFKKSLSSYRESKNQKDFFTKHIDFCNFNGIKLLIYKPIVSPHLQKLLDDSPAYQQWQKEILSIANSKKVTLLDFARIPIQCQKFLDVHHLSGGCYPELTNIIIQTFL